MTEQSTITVCLSASLLQKLEILAESTQRSQSRLVSEAIAAYLEQQSRQMQQIQDALELAEQPQTQWIQHEAVSHWLQCWDNESRFLIQES